MMESSASYSEDWYPYSDAPDSEPPAEPVLAAVPQDQGDEHEATASPTFESAFAALDSQAEQLQGLRSTLARLHETSAEQKRTLGRLESELTDSRAEADRQRALIGALKSALSERDQLLGSVREAVSHLGRVLDPRDPAAAANDRPS
jgi:septal ring factor EnvC (AmiA/AmiB activator)